MNKLILVGAIVTSLVGCSSGSSEPTSDNSEPTSDSSEPTSDSSELTEEETAHLLLNGTWLSECRDDILIATSTRQKYTFKNGAGSYTVVEYPNGTCIGTGTPLLNTDSKFTYTLGSKVTVDGSVPFVTSAREIDFVDDFGTELGIYAIDGVYAIDGFSALYITTNIVNPASRPTELLNHQSFTFQP